MCIPTHPIKKSASMGSLPPASLACTASPFVVDASTLPAPIRSSPFLSTRRLRRVHFEDEGESDASCSSSEEGGESSVVPPPCSPPSPLNQLTDWSGVWYAPSDLVGFRDEARKHCRALRQSLLTAVVVANGEQDEYSSDSSSGSSTSSSSAAASEPFTLDSCGGDDEECRGLEARSCLERQRRKYLTNRCIVRAQSQLNRDQLAMLAQKCSSWAAALAAQEGERDYRRAYGGGSDSDFSTSHKRLASASPTFEVDRRVRSRTV